MKFINYEDQPLPGSSLVTFKIDGVQAVKTESGIQSRHGKPLYNIPDFEGRVEVFLGNFKDTISATRTKKYKFIDSQDLFQLEPSIDERLVVGLFTDMSSDDVKKYLDYALLLGYEGLVIYNEDKRYKVKPTITHDLKVIDYQEGTGKFGGLMGALITEKCKVGTGFTVLERQTFTKDFIIGKVIEVTAMEVLASGNLRHPRFVRLREDKV